MSVQRWSVDFRGFHRPDDNGTCVGYADHVAALAEVEQRVRDEERSHFQEAVWTFDRGYRQGRAEALRQAREAVAGGFTTLANDPFISPEGRKEVDHYLTGAIEEIDALKGEQA